MGQADHKHLAIKAIEKPGPAGIDIALPPSGLDLNSGRMTAIIGSNGSGKTTLVEAILGVRVEYNAIAEFLGADIRKIRAAEKSKLGVSLQSSKFAEGVRLEDVIKLHSRSYHMAVDTSLLRELGLVDELKSLFSHLSGGQAKKLSLYFAISHQPCLAILDEPEAGLDRQGLDVVLRCLDERSRSGMTTLVATHSPAVLSAADDVVHIDRGTVVFHGSKDTFYTDHLAPAVLEVDLGSIAPDEVQGLVSKGKMHCFDGPRKERVVIFGKPSILEKALLGAEPALAQKCILREARAVDALCWINVENG